MAGAIFQALLAGASSVRTTYQGSVANALSGTYTVPSATQLVVMCFSWQSISLVTPTVTISGHPATIITTTGTQNSATVIAAAIVSPGDPNTFSATGSAIFSSRAYTFIYTVAGIARINSPSNGTSIANPATATLNVPANSAVFGVVSSQVSYTPVWSGIAIDEFDNFNIHTFTSAHSDFSIANPALVVSCTVNAGWSGSFAVLTP